MHSLGVINFQKFSKEGKSSIFEKQGVPLPKSSQLKFNKGLKLFVNGVLKQ